MEKGEKKRKLRTNWTAKAKEKKGILSKLIKQGHAQMLLRKKDRRNLDNQKDRQLKKKGKNTAQMDTW